MTTTYIQAIDIIGHERGQAVARVALVPDQPGYAILHETVRWEAATGAGKGFAVQDALGRLRDRAATITGPDPALLTRHQEET